MQEGLCASVAGMRECLGTLKRFIDQEGSLKPLASRVKSQPDMLGERPSLALLNHCSFSAPVAARISSPSLHSCLSYCQKRLDRAGTAHTAQYLARLTSALSVLCMLALRDRSNRLT